MSDNQSEGEGDFTNETKYKQYSASVERALKSFELSTEWHDLISSLARINKVFLAYKQYPVVPIQLTVCKRLSQCLHPNLPSGVHLKTLNVYKAIFDRLGAKGLASNLLVYSSALFPLLGYASMSVRPHLLEIYEQYYLPLGDELMPALHGFILGLLPGLEDESEHTDRICRLLDKICAVTDESAFFCALWQCVLGSPDIRLPAVSFILSKLNKKVTAEDQVYCLGGHLPLVVSALCSALHDKNVLVGRAVLDIITILFPLHQSFLVPADLTTILSAALQTLLKRDVSLNRRLYSWLLGTSVDKSQLANRLPPLSSTSSLPSSPQHERPLFSDMPDLKETTSSSRLGESYFEIFSKVYLVSALKMIITQASLSAKHGMYKADCILPYRLLRALIDKPELGLPVLNDIMYDLVCCLKQQISDLGGVTSTQTRGTNKSSKTKGVLSADDSSKKLSKKGALKAEILQSSNLFFSSLDSEVLWKWVTDVLKENFSRLPTNVAAVDESAASKSDRELRSVAREESGSSMEENKEELNAQESASAPLPNVDCHATSPSSSPTSELVEVHLIQLTKSHDQREKPQQQQRENVVDGRNGRPAVLRTNSNQTSSSSLLNLASGVDTRDFSFVLDLIKFLIQSLPLDSLENAHKYHLPHLLLALVSELVQKEKSLATRELLTCFSLASHIIQELLSFSSSHSNSLASTPSTPLALTPADSPSLARAAAASSFQSSAAQRQLSEDLLTRQLEEFKSLITINYLEFFSSFLDSRVLKQDRSNDGMMRTHLKATLSGACDLLLQTARLSPEIALIESDHSDPPVWLKHLMSSCLPRPHLHNHHHIAFVSLETLLTLLEWQLHTPHPLTASSHGQVTVDIGGPMRFTFFSKASLNHILLNVLFEKSVSEFLWQCLGPVSVELHDEAAVLMSWLNSLFAPSSVCEKVVLEDFTTQGLTAYQSFAALWQYSPSLLHHTQSRPFNKAILRMLEGLQNKDAAVRHFVGSWVRHITSREEDTGRLLQPLLRILAKAEPLRRSELSRCPYSPYEVRLTKEEAAKDPAYAKYYFASLGFSDPEEATKKSQYKDSLLYYVQVFDISQVLYSLSLLLSTVSVDPTTIISCMSSMVVDSVSYLNLVSNQATIDIHVRTDHSNSGTLSSKDLNVSHNDSEQLQPGSSQKSILELLLTTCIRFLQSEFYQSLDASLDDHLDHISVKILCAELLEVVHTEFVRILGKVHSSSHSDSISQAAQATANSTNESDVLHVPDRGASVTNASYITALVTLCDVQKSTLLLLAGVVQEIRELERKDREGGVGESASFLSSSNSKLLHDRWKGASTGQISRAALWRQLLTQHKQGRAGRKQRSLAEVTDPVIPLGSLFIHLLKLVQSLITLDSQCQVCAKFSGSKSAATTPLSLSALSSKTAGVKLSNGNDLPPVISGITTASQPFFQLLLLDLLGDSSLGHLHTLVLAMFTTIMPNLLGYQVDELAPKILKQLCSNLEQPRNSEKLHELKSHQKGKIISSREQKDIKRNSISYLEAVVTIILWCLFGEKDGGFSLQNGNKASWLYLVHTNPSPYRQSLNLFWRVTSVAEREEKRLDHTPTLKQTSTIAWLFGVFSQKGGVAEIGSGGGGTGMGGGGGERDGGSAVSNTTIGASSTGLTSLVGQYVIMLLPAVYKVLTDLWRVSSSVSVSRDGPAETSLLGGGVWGISSTSSEAVMVSPFFEKISVKNSKMECGELQQLMSQLLCPLAEREPTAFFSSISHVWLEWNLETQARPSKKLNKRKDTFIEMLHRIEVLPLERVISCVQDTLAEIAHLDDLESSVLRQKYLLHFLYKYISSALQSSEELGDCRTILVAFLRDCFNLCYTPRPECLTNNCHILCMLTSILHVFVCRVPAPDPKKFKKERKELQDVTHKLCEAMSTTANIGLNQADYVMINRAESTSSGLETGSVAIRSLAGSNEVRGEEGNREAMPNREETEGPKTVESGDIKSLKSESVENGPVANQMSPRHHVTGESSVSKDVEGSRRESGATITMSASSKETTPAVATAAPGGGGSGGELQLPAKQALAVLSNVLSHFIDCIFDGTEKDKVISLLKSVMYNVWPHLHNHSFDFQPCYMHAVKLLSSLSGFQVTRKAWRKEAFDLFLNPSFFVVEFEALREWKVVIDNLMTQDQVTFRDLLTRLNSSAATGVVNIFSSLEQEVLTGARLVKRMAFALFSGETDQYVSFLPDIQEKLSEYLKFLRYPAICSEVLLAFRVLLIKFSPPHLLAFWPAIVAELLSLLGRLESDLRTELSEEVIPPPARLQLYLSACKLLDTATALPSETLPHFQLLQWGFTSHRAYSESEALIVTRLCRQYQNVKNDAAASHLSPPAPNGFPRLQMNNISSLKELKPLFDALLYQNRSIASNHQHHHHHHHHHTSSSSSFNSKSSYSLHHITSSVAASGLTTSAHHEARMAAVDDLLLSDFIEALS